MWEFSSRRRSSDVRTKKGYYELATIFVYCLVGAVDAPCRLRRRVDWSCAGCPRYAVRERPTVKGVSRADGWSGLQEHRRKDYRKDRHRRVWRIVHTL